MPGLSTAVLVVLLTAVVLLVVIVGLLLWLVRSFGDFADVLARDRQVFYYEVINLREESRRLRELNDTLTKKSA